MKYIPCTLDEEKEILNYLGFDSFEEFISSSHDDTNTIKKSTKNICFICQCLII